MTIKSIEEIQIKEEEKEEVEEEEKEDEKAEDKERVKKDLAKFKQELKEVCFTIVLILSLQDSQERTKAAVVATSAKNTKWFNKQKVLILASRGTNAVFRHVMNDIKDLLPHHKAETKFDLHNDVAVRSCCLRW